MKISQRALQTIEQKIQAGKQPIVGTTILHTAPHHDDILLGYFPYALRNIAGNTNHVLYVTSGAHGVSDHYLAEHLAMAKKDVVLFDAASKQELKYKLRESESEKKWALCAGDAVRIKHLRAEFYEQSDELAMAAAMQRDMQRIVTYLQEVQPDIITMLVDPVGIGPTTHNRSQQVLMAAIQQWGRPVTILGYRNIWSSFSLQETCLIIPVTQAELSRVESIFSQCFGTQLQKFIMSACIDEQGDGMNNFAQQTTFIHKSQLQQIKALLPKDRQAKLVGMAGAIFLQELIL